MKCSSNELKSLMTKAAMGAGLSHGIAIEVASGALNLGPEGPPALIEGLANKSCDWCVVKFGPSLFDIAMIKVGNGGLPQWRTELGHIDAPALLRGMAITARRDYHLNSEIDIIDGKTAITFSMIAQPCQNTGPVTDTTIDVDDVDFKALSALAHKTYVPASDASRLKGAGAGLNDND